MGSKLTAWFGMSLRDRQRDDDYRYLDELFPGVRERYKRTYRNAYVCMSPWASHLERRFVATCDAYGIATRIRPALAPTVEQLPLL